MATDGEPAQPFAAREGRLVLGPGNRLDVLLDCTLAAGATAPVIVEGTPGNAAIAAHRLRSRAAEPAGPAARPANAAGQSAAGTHGLSRRVPPRSRHRPDREAGSEPLFSVKRGRTVLLGFSNPTSENQYIHLHGHHFRLLDALDDGWKPFWLDTLPVAPQSNSRIAFVADNPGKWLLEGLSRTGSDAWFEVT